MICSDQRVSGQSAPGSEVCRGAGTECRNLQKLTRLNPMDLAFEPHDEHAAAGFSRVPLSRDFEPIFRGRLGARPLQYLLACCHAEHVTGCRGRA